jgi:hypothetical protein
MKKLLFTTVFTILCFISCANSYAQNFENSGNNSPSNYNIPPGVVFMKKFNTTLDLSYKLNGTPNLQSYEDSDLRVGKKLSNEQLDSLKDIDPVNYEYYTKANIYFNSLSKKIIEMYTHNELWYVYVFDQNLKNKLLIIK